MASQGVTANSRLAEMQMKFQKKQMVEREQKKIALTGTDFTQAPKSNIGNGKVRQMFDDRRRGAGIDRSHPLRPILTSTSTAVTTKATAQQPASNKRLAVGANVTKRPLFNNSTSIQTTNTTRSVLNNNNSISNGNINTFQTDFDEFDNIDNETFPREFSSLSLNNTHIIRSDATKDTYFKNNNNEESNILHSTVIINRRSSPKTNGIKLNPVITKKSPTTDTNGKSTSRTTSSSSRPSTLSQTTTNSTKSPLSTSNKNAKVGNNNSTTKPATFIMSVKPPPRICTPPPGMASCSQCQRHFITERLDKHEEVCRKMMSKKRKIFDASKHRVKGTEAEKYLKKGKSFGSTVSKNVMAATNTAQTANNNSTGRKSSWRKKHEEFIAAIRDAKKVQAHLAKGGKLSDLPPPPPSENPDYIQCPHCNRRFNESAAERHIPKCANMQHNKPKPTKKRF